MSLFNLTIFYLLIFLEGDISSDTTTQPEGYFRNHAQCHSAMLREPRDAGDQIWVSHIKNMYPNYLSHFLSPYKACKVTF